MEICWQNFGRSIVLCILFSANVSCRVEARCVEGNCISGTGSKIWTEDGRQYFGTFENNKPHGNGRMLYQNGAHYEGQWVRGDAHGKGRLVTKDGSEYVGEWFRGEEHGQGTIRFAAGGHFTGTFRDGKRNGYGVLYKENGDIAYKGQWKDDYPAPELNDE